MGRSISDSGSVETPPSLQPGFLPGFQAYSYDTSHGISYRELSGLYRDTSHIENKTSRGLLPKGCIYVPYGYSFSLWEHIRDSRFYEILLYSGLPCRTDSYAKTTVHATWSDKLLFHFSPLLQDRRSLQRICFFYYMLKRSSSDGFQSHGTTGSYHRSALYLGACHRETETHLYCRSALQTFL